MEKIIVTMYDANDITTSLYSMSVKYLTSNINNFTRLDLPKIHPLYSNLSIEMGPFGTTNKINICPEFCEAQHNLLFYINYCNLYGAILTFRYSDFLVLTQCINNYDDSLLDYDGFLDIPVRRYINRQSSNYFHVPFWIAVPVFCVTISLLTKVVARSILPY